MVWAQFFNTVWTLLGKLPYLFFKWFVTLLKGHFFGCQLPFVPSSVKMILHFFNKNKVQGSTLGGGQFMSDSVFLFRCICLGSLWCWNQSCCQSDAFPILLFGGSKSDVFCFYNLINFDKMSNTIGWKAAPNLTEHPLCFKHSCGPLLLFLSYNSKQ